MTFILFPVLHDYAESREGLLKEAETKGLLASANFCLIVFCGLALCK
jgi:hypothetical protein